MAKKGTPNEKLWAVILAGGKGQRLFPLSNPTKEKQFVWISPETGSLLQNTIRRFISIGVKSTNVVIITTCDRQTQLASDDALSLGVLSQNIYQIAPDLGYTGAMDAGTKFISRIDNSAIITNSPSDQLIEKNASFKDSMQTAIEYANKGSFVNVGVRITDLVTYMGTGHMQYDKEGRITKFIEKPDRELADKLMREGNTACNTGINVWRADRYLDAVEGENLKDMPTDKFMEILMRKDLRAVVEDHTVILCDVNVHAVDLFAVAVGNGICHRRSGPCLLYRAGFTVEEIGVDRGPFLIIGKVDRNDIFHFRHLVGSFCGSLCRRLCRSDGGRLRRQELAGGELVDHADQIALDHRRVEDRQLVIRVNIAARPRILI